MSNGGSQGLFVVVAIIIFGIFIATSYLIFGDRLKTSLTTIFEDSTSKVSNIVEDRGGEVGGEDGETVGFEDIGNNQAIAKVNGTTEMTDADIEKLLLGDSEAADKLLNSKSLTYFIKVEKLSNNTWSIVDSAITKDFLLNNKTYNKGWGIFNENATIPNEINGLLVTEIGESSFMNSSFTGKLTLPNSLERLGTNSFSSSKFTGTLSLPKNLKNIAGLRMSTFSGELTLPNSLESIDYGALQNSKFTGNLILPEGFKKLEGMSLEKSNFDGKIVIPNSVELIDTYSLTHSTFKELVDNRENKDSGKIMSSAIGLDYSLKGTGSFNTKESVVDSANRLFYEDF